jgi:PhnB protein
MINAYLHFPGTCEEALRFYEAVFGGKIESLMRHGESPMKGQVGPHYEDKVLHASLAIAGGQLLASDAPEGYYSKPQGFGVSVVIESTSDAERVFNELARGGRINMPFAQTFWAERFGMVVDRFDIPWMITGGHAPK